LKKFNVLVPLGLVILALALLPATGSAAGTIKLGVYEPVGNSSGSAIDQYTSMVGKKPAFAWMATTWQDSYGNYNQFNPAYLDMYRTRGIMPGMTWEPSRGTAELVGPNQPDFSWKQIIAGRHDAYITQVAQAAAAYHYPFLLRVLHEMNGNWYPWGYGVNGNTNPADSSTAWKHIVNIFRAAGATNVQFVYCFSRNDTGFFNTYGTALKQAYPGDTYVDWLGLDGYNKSQANWRSLQDTFAPSYKFLTSISIRPMIIFETGSIENSTDPMAKANWITQGFLTTIPSQFPRVRIAAWFDSKDSTGVDYSLDTSNNSLSAWKQVAASPLYQYP
jgi:Glycosyl hydrolase family 26